MSRSIRTTLAMLVALVLGLTAAPALAAPAALAGPDLPIPLPTFAPCATGEVTSHGSGAYEPRVFGFAIQIQPCPGTTAELPAGTVYAIQVFWPTYYRTRVFPYASRTEPTTVHFDDGNRVSDRRAVCLAYNTTAGGRLSCFALDALNAQGLLRTAPIPLTDPRLAVPSRGYVDPGDINPHCGTCV